MSITEADKILCRRYLAEKDHESIRQMIWDRKEMWWFQIYGITDFYRKFSREQYTDLFTELLSGCMITACCIGYLIIGDAQKGVRIYAGITDDEELYDAFRDGYRASFPGIDMSEQKDILLDSIERHFGGILTGIPRQISGEGIRSTGCGELEKEILPLDRLCRGLLGCDFTLLIVAERQPDIFLWAAAEKIDVELMNNSSLISTSKTGEGGWQLTVKNEEAQHYQQDLELMRKMLLDGVQTGMWGTCVYYGADTQMDMYRLKSMLLSNYSGREDSRLEAIHCMDIEGGLTFLREGVCFPANLDPHREKHPLNRVTDSNMEFYRFIYQTMMSSKDLAEYIRLPQRETIGFYVDNYVEFDTMVRIPVKEPAVRIGNITEPGRKNQRKIPNTYRIPLEDLSRHVLITGITGGGKTNTMKVLLSEIWRINGVPFLVIESAKREYIELRQINPLKNGEREFDSVDVFTLGNESVRSVRYRINPFEVMPGIALQTHIDYLLSTFNASFEMIAPMPYILEQAVYKVYEDKGWNLFTGKNVRGLTEYPTLSQLYYKIDVVTDSMGYDVEVQSNVKAALKARINSLRIGGKGAMMDTAHSIPVKELLKNPTIFELEDIGDDDTKAFVIGILLVQIYEYRKACGSCEHLLGVLVIEEAHRLLKKVTEGEGNNVRGKAVEFFCNMLAEIRSFGQGIIIADQVPTKLATDTVKNTNLKIVHRIVMEDDRSCVGAAMHMTSEQTDYLCSLRRGCAAVFSEGDNRPKLVSVPLIKMKDKVSRDIQIARIQQSVLQRFGSYYSNTEIQHAGCYYCENRDMCPSSTFIRALFTFPLEDLRKENSIEIKSVKKILQVIKCLEEEQLKRVLSKPQKLCAMGYLLKRFPISEERQAEFMVELIRWLYPE